MHLIGALTERIKMTKLEKSNGLRTAVKLGEITPEAAIAQLDELAKSNYVRPGIYKWVRGWKERNK